MKSKIKIALLLFGIIVFASLPTVSVKADAWGTNAQAAFLKEALEEAYKTIQGIKLSVLKQTAAQTMQKNVGNLISSGNGKALVITNWDDFLVKQPVSNTNLYMNDFFTMTSKGTASSSNYSAAGLLKEGTQNYSSVLIAQAKKSTTNTSFPVMDLNKYTSDPSQMFSTGNWRAFNSFISNPANNQFGYTLLAQDAYASKLAAEQNKAAIQAIAYNGFKAKMDGDTVLTPGSTVKDIYSQTSDLPNKIVAGATSPEEVITALLTRLVTQTLTQGIGQNKAQRDTTSTNSNATNQILQKVLKNGPGQIFKSSY